MSRLEINRINRNNSKDWKYIDGLEGERVVWNSTDEGAFEDGCGNCTVEISLEIWRWSLYGLLVMGNTESQLTNFYIQERYPVEGLGFTPLPRQGIAHVLWEDLLANVVVPSSAWQSFPSGYQSLGKAKQKHNPLPGRVSFIRNFGKKTTLFFCVKDI